MKKRHYAQVARFRIETAFIEFEADEDDADAAERLAVQKVKQLADSDWHLKPFNGEDQAPFVMSIIDEAEAEELSHHPFVVARRQHVENDQPSAVARRERGRYPRGADGKFRAIDREDDDSRRRFRFVRHRAFLPASRGSITRSSRERAG